MGPGDFHIALVTCTQMNICSSEAGCFSNNNMSDIDLDEDLLALAGAGGSGLDSDGPADQGSNKRNSYDDEEDEEEEETSQPSKKKRHKQEAEEDEFENPYPLEGKYVDDDDKERIESMDEMAREELLYTRAQEMNEYNEKVYLAQRAAREKVQVQEERASRSKKVKETSKSNKSSKLSELKKQRDRKARKDAGDGGDDSVDEDADDNDDYNIEEEGDDYDIDAVGEDYGDDEDDDYNPDRVDWAKEKVGPREVTLADINKIRVGRNQCAKFLYYPEFKETIKECVARFNIGLNRQTNQPIYRMVKILTVEPGRKPYKLDGSYVSIYAVCSVGKGQPKKVGMDFFSNSPLTQEEFDKFKSYEDSKMLSKKIEKKYSQLKSMATRSLSNDESKKVITKKQTLNRNYVGANAVARRSELTANLQIAQQANDSNEIARIEHELSKYQNARQKDSEMKTKYDKLSSLDKVNERNRRQNQDLIRKAELMASEKRKKELNTGVTSNPFSRLKTNVRLYYQNAQEEAAEKAQAELMNQEVEEKEKEIAQKVFFVKAKYRQIGQLDKIIKNEVLIDLVI